MFYPNCRVDENGEPLTGERRDVLHFDADAPPPVSVFWKLAM
jgi:hypothetical protein